MNPIMLSSLVILYTGCLTIAPASGQGPFQVSSKDGLTKNESITNFDSTIKIGDTDYKEWPALRSLLEGIGKGYLMLEELGVQQKSEIKFNEDTGHIVYETEKPVSVAFLGKGGNGMNGLVSFLVLLLKGNQQIIFHVSRDETEQESKEEWAGEIANKVFEEVPVDNRIQTCGCTKQQFIAEVVKIINEPKDVNKDTVEAIHAKYRQISKDVILKVVADRKARENISRIIWGQFTTLLETVKNKLGVKIIRQPDPTDGEANQIYYDDLIYLEGFKNKIFLGDDQAGKGRVGDAIKTKAYQPLFWLNLINQQQNLDNSVRPRAIWAADVQSFRTTLPTDWELKEDWEKPRLTRDMKFPVSPKYTTVIGVFTGEEKDADFLDHKYSICQTAQIFDFINQKINEKTMTFTGLKEFRYAIPRAKKEEGWQSIYTEGKFDDFKKAILLKEGCITVTIGVVADGAVVQANEKVLRG